MSGLRKGISKTRDDDWPQNQRKAGGPLKSRSAFSLTQLESQRRQILVRVVQIQSDQPWADRLMQRNPLGWSGVTDPLDVIDYYVFDSGWTCNRGLVYVRQMRTPLTHLRPKHWRVMGKDDGTGASHGTL